MPFFKRKTGKKEEPKKNLLQNPKILEVNLIKDEVKISFDWSKNLSILLIVLFISAAFITEIYLGLDLWEQEENQKVKALEDNIIVVNRDISKIKAMADEALSYKDKSMELSRLLSEHIYWTSFFNWIEKNTLSTVKFDAFSGDTKGVYSFSAKALSYAEVSWQVKAFLNDPLVKKVEVASVNSAISKEKGKEANNGVSFSLSFELNPEIFKK